MRSYCFILGSLAVFLLSCEKKELPVKAHDQGNVITSTVDMGTPYKWQVYFNLRTNTVVGQNLKTAWDISCEASQSGYHITLNASKAMFAFKTTKTVLTSVSNSDTLGFAINKKWDAPSGNMDSTAIGDWRTDRSVYIIDKGYDQNGAWQGMEKLQLLSVTDTNYTIHFAAINGSGEATLSIKKDSSYNSSFVSFTDLTQVSVEPPKATWDIVFSQYLFVFYTYNPPLPYLVTGCVLNRYNTAAVKDTTDQFAQIAYSNVSSYKWSSDITTIGYDWKTYTGGSYIINTGYNYIIQTADSRYYKLHFVGYYNSKGAEGNPKWEYQQL
ncbi:MAG: HmuY family protein [Flavipsychrobacter sp.]|nr:HmuY family protein [Flavipsychrobacter sp.]